MKIININLKDQSSSELDSGLVKLADLESVILGESDSEAVTPFKLKQIIDGLTAEINQLRIDVDLLKG